MNLLARPTTLVSRDYGRLGALHKAPDMRSGPRSVVVYSGGAPVASYPGLGVFGIDSLISGVFGLIGADKQASAEKYKAKMEYKGMELAAHSQEVGYQYAFAAEQAKSSADVTKSVLEANSALSALRTQRMAMIDGQANQLVANTQNGIFGLASTGIVEAGATSREMNKRAMWGAVLVVGVIALAISSPKLGFKKKGSGEFFRRDIRRDETTSAAPTEEVGK